VEGFIELAPIAGLLMECGHEAGRRYVALADRYLAALPGIEEALRDRAEEGLYDLQHACGEALGCAVIDAQCWHLYTVHSRFLKRMGLQPIIDGWVWSAVNLDHDSIDLINAWKRNTGISDEHMLPAVAGPITPWERDTVKALRLAGVLPTIPGL